jgi:hypothetical protein
VSDDDPIAREAAGDGWWGRWRAVQAWELTFETPIVVACVIWRVMEGDTFIVDAMTKLTPVITFYLTARYAVLGVHVWRGSQERQLAMTEQARSSRAD